VWVLVAFVGVFLTLILWSLSLIVTLVGREHRTADALAGTVVIKRTKAPTDALSS